MSRIALKTIAKWIWILAIVVFVSFYAYRSQEAIRRSIAVLGWSNMFTAFLLVLCAKFGLVLNMRIAATQFRIPMSWGDCFRIYHLTQLAKYIPGSIWQFIGRISVLRERGVDGAIIRDALLAENLRVILVASILGALLMCLSSGAYLATWVTQFIDSRLYGSFVLAGTLAAIPAAVLGWLRRHKIAVFWDWLASLLPSFDAIWVLLLTWFILGASIWITLLPFLSAMPSFAYVVGAYSIAYVVGFVVPFAPAGLGIREAFLVLALSPLVGNEISLLLAGINRLVYFLAELLLAGLSVCIGTSTLSADSQEMKKEA